MKGRNIGCEFERYFFFEPEKKSNFGLGGLSVFYMSRMGENRNELSTIIESRVYLTNLPKIPPLSRLSSLHNLPNEDNAALIVHCLEIFELAETELLLEPDAKRLSYHILAMEDVTAHVGSYEQIIEALVKMSFYADLNKPILLHCYSGVGRSAMMTALHLAHRYLIGDTVVREAINTLRLGLEKTPLDPQHEDYISKLYYAATKFVAYHRTCCQFDSHKRNNQAIAILTELGRRLATGEPLIKHTGDDYHFLSSLTQSLEFKKLQYHYFHVFGAEKHVIKKLFDDMLWNAPDWHKKLADLAADKSPMQYYQIPDASHEKLRGLLSDVLAVIHRLAEQMPDVSYSQQTVAKQEAEVLQGFEEGCESSPRPFN